MPLEVWSIEIWAGDSLDDLLKLPVQSSSTVNLVLQGRLVDSVPG